MPGTALFFPINMTRKPIRQKTRCITQYGMIAVCENHPMFIGEVLDISAEGMAIKCFIKPVVKHRNRRIRLMGPKGIKIEDIPAEIVYISKTPFIPANNKQDKDRFYRVGIRLAPKTGQADKIHQLIDVIRKMGIPS